MKDNDNEYECAVCHGVFTKGWSDEEARAEEKSVFGENDPDAAIICDDCYKKMKSPRESSVKIPDSVKKRIARIVTNSMIYGGAFSDIPGIMSVDSVQMPFDGEWKREVKWRIPLSIRISLFFYRLKSFLTWLVHGKKGW